MLNQLSGNTTDFVDGTNTCQPIQPVIWSVRLRSVNIIGNPNWAIIQRNVGSTLTNPADNSFIEDRWIAKNAGGGFQFTLSRIGGVIYAPGTNYLLADACERLTLTTQKTTLVAGDVLGFQQIIEGPCWRPLSKDVHSLSILCRSSVANLTFGLALRDPGGTRSLTKLCTLGAANTFTLITLPNLPLWDAGGTFTSAVGSAGYLLTITLAAGTTWMNSANDSWISANALGAPGQANFAASPVSSTFDLCAVQHEPGSQCTTLQDLPFDSNLSACQRYYDKTYSYGTAPGTATAIGSRCLPVVTAAAIAYGTNSFKRTMAKAPTMTFYNYGTGAANSIRDSLGADHAGPTANNINDSGFGSFSFTTAMTGAGAALVHWVADTGW
jgi:hypothetical protein